MATNAEHKLLVNLNMNGQVIKDFRVDVVNNLPSTGEEGRMVYRTTSPIGLYIMKSTGWTLLEDAGTVKVDATDTSQSYLDAAISVKAPGLLKRVFDYGSNNKILVLENDHINVKAMEDVRWSPAPASDALFGYSPALGKFVPVIINPSLEVTTTGSATNPTISIGVRKISIHHNWAILGPLTEDRKYPGYYSKKGIESILIRGLSVSCAKGSGWIQVFMGGTAVVFSDSGSTSLIRVGKVAKHVNVASSTPVWDGAYMDIKFTPDIAGSPGITETCEDLSATLWLLQD